MLFQQPILAGIAAGQITQAFRRWRRPTVKAGGTLRTTIGVLAIEAVEPIAEAVITAADAQAAGFTSRADLLESLRERPGQLYRIRLRRAGDDPRIALREQKTLSPRDAAELLTRLARLDARSPDNPWTRRVLQLIERHPHLRAADLAARSGEEKEWLKRQIRKLKNLGLTESRTTGYRLSPRGQALMRRSAAQPPA